MKPGPIIAMVALIFVGMWLVLQPTLERGQRIDPDAHRIGFKLGAREVTAEFRSIGDTYEYSTKGWPGTDELGWVPAAEFQNRLADAMAIWEAKPAWERTMLGFFNITSWLNFSWVAIGLLGQACFFGRMFVQWIKSEKERSSVVPPVFWWLSFFGGVMLFTYFVWRVDFVGVLGQSSGVVIYARNLRLIHKEKSRAARRGTGQGDQPRA